MLEPRPTPDLNVAAPRTTAVVVLGVFVASLALLAGYGFAFEFPVPRVHDEFAYLLTADTFAHGRLTNPTPPSWAHFDTFHVFFEPTYQAKYPPGQGAVLALGQVLFGHPAWGLWLGFAAALAAVVWMLAAVLPLGWSASAALVLLGNAFVFTRWGQTYWGGGVALLGGALLGGGLLRCLRGPRAVWASVAGLGLFVLANTRPLEGALVALFTLPVWFAPVAARSGGARASRRSASARLLAPLGVALAVTLAFTAVYDHALTGDALRLPYRHWDKYASSHDLIQFYAGSEDASATYKVARLVRFFFGDVLVWVLPVLLVRPSRLVVDAALLVGLLGAVSVAGTRAWPHYLAPVAPWALLLLVQALRRLAAWRVHGKPVGAGLAFALLAAHVAIGGSELGRYRSVGPPPGWHRERRDIEQRLAAEGAPDLVLVRYGPAHSVHEEWVYNAADLESAPVIWARDLGELANRALLERFADRTVWRLVSDGQSMVLRPMVLRPRDGVTSEPD